MPVNKSSEPYKRRAKNYRDKVTRRFKQQLGEVPLRAVEALTEGLKDIAATALDYTPLDKGPLRASQYIQVNKPERNKYVGVVGYASSDVKLGNVKENTDHAPYAVFVHEIPANNYTTAGTGHLFLTRAFDEHKEQVLKDIVAASRITRNKK